VSYALYAGALDPVLDATGFFRNAAIAVGIFITTMIEAGYYKPHAMRTTQGRVGKIVSRWLGSIVFLAFILFLFKQGADISRVSTLLFATFGVVGLVAVNAWRSSLMHLMISRGVLAPTRYVVIGSAGEIELLPDRMRLDRLGVQFVGPFLLGQTQEHDANVVRSAISAARYGLAEGIILALPWAESERIEALRSLLRTLPLPVRLVPDSVVADLRRHPEVQLGFSPAYELQREPLSALERLAKRGLDLGFATAALILLAPLFLITALVIKLDSRGPVLFRQKRSGFDGQVFNILKFRTMHVLEDGDVIHQARKGDVRITRVGRFLRVSSIDEIPQLLNVLAGDMSLVGPRPHAVAHNDHYEKLVAEYAFRHHVKPGITGWAQIHGLRGETSHLSQMEARIQRDLEYIASWSLLLDLWILVRTVYEGCRPRNAA
jgi:undecaprenyl-phosphate galactose phosphotransferase/putative colanic acid biosynthesis UDP-glucose lipid carrier transferase